MSKIIIKNGLVFDPINDIEGEKKDILIEDGIIVEKLSSEIDVNEIDASGKTIIPSGVEIHAHVASQQVNWARLLGSKNKLFQDKWKGLTLKRIAMDYVSNGYTFILDANVFPSLASQTIFNFKQMPILDKAFLLNVSNLWQLELEYQKGRIEDLSVFVSDLLEKTRGFGIKAYNPFENEAWNFQELRGDLTSKGRLYNFSALDVYENMTKANEYLELPHSIHAHVEGYETDQGKSNLALILEKIAALDLNALPKQGRSQIFHLAHASTYNVDGGNAELINLINGSDKLDLDLGIITFNPINPLITSDRRLINEEVNSDMAGDFKLIRSAVEAEGDTFTALRSFDKNNGKHCIYWANAIELALKITDKWKVQLSFNYPNYGDVNDLPEIATWLMSIDARKEFMGGLSIDPSVKAFSNINDNVLSFQEFIIISRASPARSLGLGNIKGSLGFGADADINILNINMDDIDPSKEPNKLKKALKEMEYVIKSGKIVKNRDKLRLDVQGKIFWAEGKIKKADTAFILKKKKEFYEKYCSIFYDTLKTTKDEKLFRKID